MHIKWQSNWDNERNSIKKFTGIEQKKRWQQTWASRDENEMRQKEEKINKFEEKKMFAFCCDHNLFINHLIMAKKRIRSKHRKRTDRGDIKERFDFFLLKNNVYHSNVGSRKKKRASVSLSFKPHKVAHPKQNWTILIHSKATSWQSHSTQMRVRQNLMQTIQTIFFQLKHFKLEFLFLAHFFPIQQIDDRK